MFLLWSYFKDCTLVAEKTFLHKNNFIWLKGETLDDVPQAVIEDCAQLVKANSIQGETRSVGEMENIMKMVTLNLYDL